MIDANIKEGYKTLIQKIDTDHPLKDVVESFIDRYEGTDEILFNLVTFGMINTLMELKVLTIESRGFQDIQAELDAREKKILELREELLLFDATNQPGTAGSVEPFVNTSTEELDYAQTDSQE